MSDLATAAPLLLNTRQAAALVGVSRSQFLMYRNQGRIPKPVRLSSRVVRWNAQELREWTAAGCPPRATWEALKASATPRKSKG